jgi:hypothetical protein
VGQRNFTRKRSCYLLFTPNDDKKDTITLRLSKQNEHQLKNNATLSAVSRLYSTLNAWEGLCTNFFATKTGENYINIDKK